MSDDNDDDADDDGDDGGDDDDDPWSLSLMWQYGNVPVSNS